MIVAMFRNTGKALRKEEKGQRWDTDRQSV